MRRNFLNRPTGEKNAGKTKEDALKELVKNDPQKAAELIREILKNKK